MKLDEKALEALANYQQADADGVMVLVSRQAIDECLPILRAYLAATSAGKVAGLGPMAAAIDRAAIKWCDKKNRETGNDDILYFKNNWSALPGLQAYVLDEVSAALEAAQERAVRAEAEIGTHRKTLRQCYATLAFCFNRLHQSARSRDGELCLDIGKVRAQIEVLFKNAGVKL